MILGPCQIADAEPVLPAWCLAVDQVFASESGRRIGEIGGQRGPYRIFP